MFFVIKTALLEKLCQFSPKDLYAVTDVHLPSTGKFISIGSPDKSYRNFRTRNVLDAFSSGRLKHQRFPNGAFPPDPQLIRWFHAYQLIKKSKLLRRGLLLDLDYAKRRLFIMPNE